MPYGKKQRPLKKPMQKKVSMAKKAMKPMKRKTTKKKMK